MNKESLKNLLRKYSPVLGFLLAISISVLIFIYKDKLLELEEFGLLGLFLLNMLGSATLFMPTPLFLTAFAAAAVYNPLLVAGVSSLGNAIGELTGYLAGSSGRVVLEKNLNIQRAKRWMDKYGAFALFFLAAIPNPIFDAAGIVAGVYKIPVWKYFVFVWLGKIVKFLVISYAGAISLRSIVG